MRTCVDSSAFAKRFIEEEGSAKIEDICSRATELGLSVLCVPEIISALNRRRREGNLTSAQYRQAKQRLLEDVRDADIIQLTPDVVAKSIEVLESTPLRGADALHIACAIEWGAELFVSSDKAQLAAAKKAGLSVKAV
ncbi:MAG: type II toxin-antitoxin system VapC family toxin [Chthoniobacterales bacterium]